MAGKSKLQRLVLTAEEKQRLEGLRASRSASVLRSRAGADSLALPGRRESFGHSPGAAPEPGDHLPLSAQSLGDGRGGWSHLRKLFEHREPRRHGANSLPVLAAKSCQRRLHRRQRAQPLTTTISCWTIERALKQQTDATLSRAVLPRIGRAESMLYAAQLNSKALGRIMPYIPASIPKERLSQQALVAVMQRHRSCGRAANVRCADPVEFQSSLCRSALRGDPKVRSAQSGNAGKHFEIRTLIGPRSGAHGGAASNGLSRESGGPAAGAL